MGTFFHKLMILFCMTFAFDGDVILNIRIFSFFLMDATDFMYGTRLLLLLSIVQHFDCRHCRNN